MSKRQTLQQILSTQNILNWPWDMKQLSKNESITPDIVEMFRGWKWEQELSDNPSITMEFVERHWDWNWSIKSLSDKPSLTLEFVQRHIEHPWCISHRSFLTLEFIHNHRFMFDMEKLSKNPVITPGFFAAHVNWDWSLTGLSENPSFTEDFIVRHLKWNWSADGLCRNPSLPAEFFANYAHRWKWNMYVLSQHHAITMEFVKKHLGWEWSALGLFQNSKLMMTREFMDQYMHIWRGDLQFNTNPVVVQEIRDRLEDLHDFTKTKDGILITPELIQKQAADAQWNMRRLSRNPNVGQWIQSYISMRPTFLMGAFLASGKASSIQTAMTSALSERFVISLIFSYL